MRAEFEAGRKRVIERWKEQGLSFGAQMSVNQQGVYRQVSFRGDWEDFERRRQEVQAMHGTNPASLESVDHIRQSILRGRPELGYAPDNPRVPGDEAGFIRYVFIYLRPGTGDQAEEILKKQAALRRRHNIRDNVIVTSSVIGYDAPMLLLRFHARDMEDYYTQTRENRRMLGDEGADLRRQMGRLARRIETSNNACLATCHTSQRTRDGRLANRDRLRGDLRSIRPPIPARLLQGRRTFPRNLSC